MKMRFWQKIYALTLVLFLLCLNVGIFSLAVYTHQKNIDSMETSAKGEYNYIAMTFERDYNDGGGTNVSLLMKTYVNHYKDKGVIFALFEDDRPIYNGFPENLELENETLSHKIINEKRHVVITAKICGGKYVFAFAKNVDPLEREFRALMVVYSTTALAFSSFLAVTLFVILKRLSKPLEKLRKTTEQIESGDFSVTADESGTDELSLLAKSFNSMIAKINDQMTSLELDAEKKQMLVDNMAHELRTPLTSIRGYAEYLEKAKSDEESRMLAIRYIISESIRLQKISEILLDGAYIRENPPKLCDVDMSEMINDTVYRLKPRADEKGVRLLKKTEAMIVQGEKTLLSMLLYNLTENAIKACSPDDVVTLSCSGREVAVADTGKGMTEMQMCHITEPFYKADRSRARAEGGAGLGLSISSQIAELHKIDMTVESELGKGTTFTLTFTT